MIMVSLNITSPERCFLWEMGGEEDIILQLFSQVCLVGFWREKQSNFGSGVLSALANVDLPSSAGLFCCPSIWKSSKYGRFSTFPLFMDICNIAFHLSWSCAGSVLLFCKFLWINWQSRINVSSFRLAFPPSSLYGDAPSFAISYLL